MEARNQVPGAGGVFLSEGKLIGAFDFCYVDGSLCSSSPVTSSQNSRSFGRDVHVVWVQITLSSYGHSRMGLEPSLMTSS